MRFYKFSQVVGNTSSIAIIQQSLGNDTFPHISLFSGVSGVGKSTSAEIAGLYLTCESPVDGEPCCKCATCKNNIKALQTNGQSHNLVKHNAGNLITRDDVQELIKEIFILQSSTDNVVYIIEEVHALSTMQQTALLEEIDKVPPNVFVIFCTTRPDKLLVELRNRTLTFNFNRLSKTEMQVLFEQLCNLKGITVQDSKIRNMLINYARGIPRTLVELFEFIQNNDFENTTISDFLGLVDEESFILLFEAMNSDSLYNSINILEDLLSKRPLNIVVSQLKDFIIRVLFLTEGGIQEGFTATEVQRIRALFGTCTEFMKICNIIETMNYNVSDAEFKYQMVKVRQLLLNKKLSNIFTDDSVKAVIQSKRAKETSAEVNRVETSIKNENSLKQLNIDFLTNLGGDS